MTRKRTRPIIRGNIVVWPLIPRLTKGVNLACQRTAQGGQNVVALPVIQIPGRTNWMAHVHLKPTDIGVVRATMRSQRISRRAYNDAQKRLREIFSHPA